MKMNVRSGGGQSQCGLDLYFINWGVFGLKPSSDLDLNGQQKIKKVIEQIIRQVRKHTDSVNSFDNI